MSLQTPFIVGVHQRTYPRTLYEVLILVRCVMLTKLAVHLLIIVVIDYLNMLDVVEQRKMGKYLSCFVLFKFN